MAAAAPTTPPTPCGALAESDGGSGNAVAPIGRDWPTLPRPWSGGSGPSIGVVWSIGVAPEGVACLGWGSLLGGAPSMRLGGGR